MSDRKPNEILVAPEALQQMLSEGGARVFSVTNGPPPEAEIIGVEWRYVNGAPLVVLVYSSDVPEPLLTYEHGLERRLAELEAAAKELADSIVFEASADPSMVRLRTQWQAPMASARDKV